MQVQFCRRAIVTGLLVPGAAFDFSRFSFPDF
jgi:hypothetical protein